MKIAFVAKKMDIQGGGSNFSLELLARLLTKRGHDATILTLKPEMNNLPESCEFNIIEPPDRFLGTRLGELKKAYQVMQYYKNETDLYHVFTPSFLAAGGLFCNQDTKTPVIGRLNNYTNFCVNTNLMDGECHKNCNIRAKFKHQDASLTKRIAKLPLYASRTYVEPRLSANLDRYFAVSPAVKGIYTDVGLPPDRINVIPNFYDPDFASGTDYSLENSKQTDEQLNVLYVGRIKESKGVDVLLRALAKISNVNATIIGTGAAVSELQSLSTELRLGERVLFEGRIDHQKLSKYYKEADIFVHPGRWPEPLNRTLIESLQCGTPAVVSDIGGPPWAIGDAGVTFPPEDHVSLANILAELAEERAKIEQMSSECQNALSRHDPDRIIDSIIKNYSTACEL